MDLSPVMWGGRDESSVWGPGTHESFLCLPDSRPGFWNIFAITVNFTQSHLPLYFSSIVLDTKFKPTPINDVVSTHVPGCHTGF